ncbi:hypothetical protein C9J03_11600 [Photobacterium gaetbulicola]|uniref:Uncharacterized protein n=1 Tax=Photobacterium gaetbulicola Gung47 TaxID=658445 RepID=A0A0C5WPX8_9GAMM|nr:hypothetical protein [Photobacterium gaetbulicola]AJR09173.1 hypothetical protein H744_2c2517 [Photobacterium gaetbulicola Gung47]PSU11775.1 hypothetical protein C9J03_11600 [Photobacterium gaetbulicola]
MKICWFLCGCLSVASVGASAVSFPEVRLANDMVEMAIYLPDVEDGSYRSTRFDWSGLIHSFQLDGVEYFGRWRFEPVHDPKIHFSVNGPAQIFDNLGYGESETFVRIGIGVLKKPADEERFNFTNPYQILDHGEWQINASDHSVEFIQTLQDGTGYGYRYQKTITLDEQGFTMSHQLENTGEKAIETTVFNHHFFVIDDQKVDQQYQVFFPFSPEKRKSEPRIKLDSNSLQILETIRDDRRLFIPLTGFASTSDDHQFRVHHHGLNRGIDVKVDQPLSRLVVWANDRSLSPENFIEVNVPVGESFSWNAQYRVY